MKYCLLLFSCLLATFAQAQDEEIGTIARKFWRNGNEALQEGRYDIADSLYTLSLKYGEFVGTYFNRALARKELSNVDGFCQDMSNAAKYGDTVAIKIVLDSCGINTNVCLDSSLQPRLDSVCDFKLNIVGSKYFNRFFYVLTTADDDTLEHYLVIERDTIPFETEFYKRAEFVGGGDRFASMLQYELTNYLMGYAEILLDVDIAGNAYNYRLLSGSTKFGREALIDVRRIARFKPALKDGVPVKSTVMLSIRMFSINFKPYLMVRR